MTNNNENSTLKRPSVEAQVDAIIAQKIAPDFVVAEEVVIFGSKQDGTSIQYDSRGEERYIAREPGQSDEILRGGVVEDWNFVERGYEEEPRRNHILVDANDEVYGSIPYAPLALAMFNMHADSEAELKSKILKNIDPEEQALLDSDVVPEHLALSQIASERFEKGKQKAIVSLEGKLVENNGKIAQTKGLIAENEEKIAAIKDNMANLVVQIEEKQGVVDEYDANKPWFMKIFDFVSDNFGACAGLLVGGLGMMQCDSTALWTLSAGVATVSGLIAMDVIDGDALMKQGTSLFNKASTALGLDGVEDDVSVSRNMSGAHLGLTPS